MARELCTDLWVYIEISDLHKKISDISERNSEIFPKKSEKISKLSEFFRVTLWEFYDNAHRDVEITALSRHNALEGSEHCPADLELHTETEGKTLVGWVIVNVAK